MSQKKGTVKRTQPQRLTKILVIGGIGLIILFLGITFFSQMNSAPAKLSPEVSVAEAVRLREGGAFILDVRQPEEWEVQHIPGATLIPLGELSTRLIEVPQDKPVVVVCRSGNRSAQARDILLGAGYSEVTSMGGGMNSWSASGFETVSGK